MAEAFITPFRVGNADITNIDCRTAERNGRRSQPDRDAVGRVENAIEQGAGRGIGRLAGEIMMVVEIDRYVAAHLGVVDGAQRNDAQRRSEEHTSELQSLLRILYGVFCLKKINRK